MKKLSLVFVSIIGAASLISCNSGSSSDDNGGNKSIILTSNTAICSTAPNATNPTITYTLSGTTVGTSYNISVPTLYGTNKGQLTTIAQNTVATGSSLSITATCQNLLSPATQLESAVVSNYAVATSGTTNVLSNQVPYTATKYKNPIPSSPCPDGAAQCGASSLATIYNASIPNSSGHLISSNNMVVGNTSVANLSFSVPGITSPVSVTFTSNNGTLSAVTHTFGDSESTFNLTLQTVQGTTSYTVTPSVNSQNLTPISVNTIASTTIDLPVGTYAARSDFIDAETCAPAWIKVTLVVTADAEYSCGQEDDTGSIDRTCYKYPKETLTIPSWVDSDPQDPYFYFNGSWNNGIYKTNVIPVNGFGCPIADPLSATDKIAYTSSSTSLPYPVEDGSSLKKKALTSAKKLFSSVK